jgi:hypothetical protein
MLMSDINERAAATARNTAQRNGVSRRSARVAVGRRHRRGVALGVALGLAAAVRRRRRRESGRRAARAFARQSRPARVQSAVRAVGRVRDARARLVARVGRRRRRTPSARPAVARRRGQGGGGGGGGGGCCVCVGAERRRCCCDRVCCRRRDASTSWPSCRIDRATFTAFWRRTACAVGCGGARCARSTALREAGARAAVGAQASEKRRPHGIEIQSVRLARSRAAPRVQSPPPRVSGRHVTLLQLTSTSSASSGSRPKLAHACSMRSAWYIS